MLGNPIRYTGRFYDETTGLYDNRLRNYHPVLGRFIEPDPIGPAGGINLYAYVNSNPINFIDPLGLAPMDNGGVGYGSGQGGQDFWTAGALTGATAVVIRNGFDASAFLGVTVGRSGSGTYGVTSTSAGYSLTYEYGDFERPGGSRNSPIRGIEFDIDWDPVLGPFGAIPFFVKGGPEALFDPGLVTTDYSFGFGTIKTFENSSGNLIGGAAGLGFGLGSSRVEGGFTPIFESESPLD